MKFSFRSGGPAAALMEELYVILLVFLALLSSGCSKAGLPAISVAGEQISPNPPKVGPIKLNFGLANSAKPAVGAQVSLEADMTHAGMAPVFGDAHEIAPGKYEGQIDLNMPGDWVVILHISLPGGKKLDKQISLNGVQRN